MVLLTDPTQGASCPWRAVTARETSQSCVCKKRGGEAFPPPAESPRTATTSCGSWTTCQKPAETHLVKQICSSLFPVGKESRVLSSVPFPLSSVHKEMENTAKTDTRERLLSWPPAGRSDALREPKVGIQPHSQSRTSALPSLPATGQQLLPHLTAMAHRPQIYQLFPTAKAV